MDIAATILPNVKTTTPATATTSPVVDKPFNDFFKYMVSALKDARKTALASNDQAAVTAPATPKANKAATKIVEDAQNGGYAFAVTAPITAPKITPKKSADATEAINTTAMIENYAPTQPAQPLDVTQQTAIERIAALVADNGLDPQLLAELNGDELAELAAWIMDDANGLFTPEIDLQALLAQQIAAENVAASASAAPTGFREATAALLQLEQIRQRLGAMPTEEVARIGKLIALENLSPTQVDQLSQAILSLAENADATTDLRQLLVNVDAQTLRESIERTLPKIAAPITELPELPAVVLRSLAIEIVNVNNAELDAAEKQLALLDGLNNNAKLRAEILQTVVANAEQIGNTVDAKMLTPEVVSILLDDEKLALTSEITTAHNENPFDELTLPTAKQSIENAETLPATTQRAHDDVYEKISPSTIKTPTDNPVTPNNENVDAEIFVAEVEIDETSSATKSTVAKTIAEKSANNNAPQTTTPATEKAEISRSSSTPNQAEIKAAVFRPAETSSRSTNEKLSPTHLDVTAKIADSEETTAATTRDISTPSPLNFTRLLDNHNLTTNLSPVNDNARQMQLQENINRLAEMVATARSADTGTLKSLTLTLTPPELGSVRIEIEVVATGKISATVKAENESARNLLATGLESLRRNLEAHGVTLEKFNVELGGKDAGQQQQQSAGGAWFGAQADERERRARQSQQLRQLGNWRANDADANEIAAPAVRAGSSFELIA